MNERKDFRVRYAWARSPTVPLTWWLILTVSSSVCKYNEYLFFWSPASSSSSSGTRTLISQCAMLPHTPGPLHLQSLYFELGNHLFPPSSRCFLPLNNGHMSPLSWSFSIFNQQQKWVEFHSVPPLWPTLHQASPSRDGENSRRTDNYKSTS